MDRNPESPWNPRVPAEITPTEFERLARAWLQKCNASSEQAFEAQHLGVAQGAGGDYKIDVLVKLIVLGGACVTVLAECKHQSRPVEREDAMILEAKLRDVGAHKGILFSTSGFQTGALQYASAHGIATITVVDGTWMYETRMLRSVPAEPPPWARFDRYAGILMTSRDGKITCGTIELARVDMLKKYLSKGGSSE